MTEVVGLRGGGGWTCHDGGQLGGHMDWQRVGGLPVGGHGAESELVSGQQGLHLRGAQQGTAGRRGRHLQHLDGENDRTL